MRPRKLYEYLDLDYADITQRAYDACERVSSNLETAREARKMSIMGIEHPLPNATIWEKDPGFTANKPFGMTTEGSLLGAGATGFIRDSWKDLTPDVILDLTLRIEAESTAYADRVADYLKTIAESDAQHAEETADVIAKIVGPKALAGKLRNAADRVEKC